METSRKMKVLLQITLDNIGSLRTGLCCLVQQLRNRDIITTLEMIRLEKYFRQNKPKNANIRLRTKLSSYWWQPGSIAPRKRWLTQLVAKQ